MIRLEDAIRLVPVIAVVEVASAEEALGCARALAAGGVQAVEITLRTPAALDAIAAVAAQVPEVSLGAGTLIRPEQFRQARDAGAGWLVSPGYAEPLAEAAQQAGLPWLPGVATAGEALRAMLAGFSFLKLFPAESSGGAAAIKAFSAVYPQIRFCPTGGVKLGNLADYLAVASVACVGGSWLTPRNLLAAEAWDAVEQLALEAATRCLEIRQP
jgi:2-dehydro-3-deoxyphosphogluconate aldolase/(4S)-4-hydroxy-2-oxoglutarate aldolase